MPERLDQRTKAALQCYVADVRQLPNEAAKRVRFGSLLGDLFPGSSAVSDFAAGVEHAIRIDTAKGQKRGRMDAYYGNAVIEFEKSLSATGDEAERQLREYVSGVWAKENQAPRPLIAIASDGIVWRIYRPRLRTRGKATPRAQDVELEPLRELTLGDRTLADFWLWLTSLLFRPERTAPSAEQFTLDFGAQSPAFREALETLHHAWVAAREAPEPALAFKTWHNYLTVTYGQLADDAAANRRTGSSISELETLFLKHTYLASVARFLVWASLSKGKTKEALRDVAREVLNGQYFESRGLANLVENDFFQWVRSTESESELATVWERILDQILTYDLSHLGEDILKGAYQELVDPKDRHDLGEYYTPDWLCERMATVLLPNSGYRRVLDPTCGSGSFLRAAIAHFLQANPGGSDAERLAKVLDSVAGIDIHPLAVTISRATYLLALGPLVGAAPRPIQIPVYMADSLFLPAEVKQFELGETPGYEIRFGGDRRVRIPENVVQSADLYDGAIAACTKVAMDHAHSHAEDAPSLGAYLKKAIPKLAQQENFDEIVVALWRFTDELADLIRRHKNSIWSFIARNAYRPAMLRGHFDLIIGNPPWLSYRYLADPDYQGEVKFRAIDEYGIAPRSQKLMTQMELATVFLAHCLTTFGHDAARLGFVMPRSILTADQHANLRTRSYKGNFRLTAYWDLKDVSPLFQVPCCVLFAERGERGKSSDPIPAVEWAGKLPSRDVPWSVAENRLRETKGTGRVIYLGSHSAISTAEGRSHPSKSSVYAGRFRQGATIVPRNFYFVQVKNLHGTPDLDRLYWAETEVEQAKLAKKPYQGVQLSGHVEGRFIYCTALSKHILPFAMLEPATVLLPLQSDANGLVMRSAAELRHAGFREIATWMEKAEQIWIEKRKKKAERQSVYERLDYQGELTQQTFASRHLVIYNAAGTNLVAAYVDRRALIVPFVAEHKTYWAECASREEAAYLTAFLNSEVVNEEIKPFQSMGLMGERDIEKKVLDLPVPIYSSKEILHQRLAELGSEAHNAAAGLSQSADLPSSLARRRGWMRKQLKGILTQIDEAVRALIRAT